MIIISQWYSEISFFMILVWRSEFWKKHLGSKFLVIQVDKDFCGFKIVIFQIFFSSNRTSPKSPKRMCLCGKWPFLTQKWWFFTKIHPKSTKMAIFHNTIWLIFYQKWWKSEVGKFEIRKIFQIFPNFTKMAFSLRKRLGNTS